MVKYWRMIKTTVSAEDTTERCFRSLNDEGSAGVVKPTIRGEDSHERHPYGFARQSGFTIPMKVGGPKK